MDEDISQNIERVGSNDRCAEISERHNEDSSRDEYNDYGDGGHNFEGQCQ